MIGWLEPLQTAHMQIQALNLTANERGMWREGWQVSLKIPFTYFTEAGPGSIRDFPNHATFSVKGANLAWLDKLRVFFSLTLCNKANFDPILLVKYDVLQNGLNMKEF